MQILALYYNQLDKAYMTKVGKGSATEEESKQINKWFKEIESLLDK
jgi:adenylosuccinate synthase